MAIFLIRHGETACNAARILQMPETPLSERGIRQAEQLAHRLAGERITDILSSDLQRAFMTAERLQAATGAVLRFDSRLQERNYGAVRGLAYSEIGVSIVDPDYEPPGGECWDAFHTRVDAAWGEIERAAARAVGNLAVVTHGLVCYSLALRHLKLPARTEPLFRWGNTSLTVVESRPPWAVQLLNCTAHLDLHSADEPDAPSSG